MENPTDPATPPTPARYSQVAIALHWAIAVLVLSTMPIGWYGATFETAAAQAATNAHKSIGIIILSLTALRILWRLTHRPPPLSPGLPRLQRWAAGTVQALFYALLVILPLSGWWMSSAVPDRHSFGFGFVDIPFLPVPRGWASAGPAHFIHTNLAILMVALALLHILAALKHQFINKDGVMARMLPRRA